MTPDWLELVAKVARIAGDVALGHFRSGVTAELKADGSPVTVADRAAEQAARDWLAASFPDDGVVGEELGTANPTAARRWIMDPIDGTRTFVRGVPLWGTLVAVAEGERILAGAAYFPALAELIAAAPGRGCHWNGKRARVSEVSRLADAVVLSTDPRFPRHPHRRDAWRRLTAGSGMERTWGDCYGYLLVATGRAEVMIDDVMSAWDAAALQPIIEEAGGVFTDWSGRATAFGGDAIATNRALSEEVRALLLDRPA